MFSIAFKEARSFFRNAPNLFFTIFFPSMCVFFLGTFLESIEVSDKAVGELSIAYYIEQKNSVSAAAFEEFIQGLEDKGVVSAEKINFHKLSDAERQSYSAAVELKDSDIIIYSGSDKIKNRTVKALFDSYHQISSAYLSVAVVNPAAVAGVQVSDQSFVKQKDLGTNRSMMDYYAVTMAVMIMFMGSCIGGSESYINEQTFCTMDRLDVSPLNKTYLYFGKIIGALPMVILQVGAVMLTSTLFFDAHYCNTIGGNVLLIAMFFCASLAALSFGILFNLFFPMLPSSLVIMPIVWISCFFSGTFAMDIHINGVSEKLPMYVIQKAAFDLTIFSREEKAVHVIAASLIILVVIVLISIVKVNVRKKTDRRQA